MSELRVVLAVSVISWGGILYFLLRLDARIKALERQYDSR